MGLYVKGANGAFSGKVGSVIGSNWRAVNYLRSLPKPSSKKATEKQIAHRAKFSLVMEFLSPMRDLINKGYNDASKSNKTGFNAATNDLMKMVQGQYPDFTIPYKDVSFAKGGLGNIYPSIGESVTGDIEVTWVNDPNRYKALPTDKVTLVLYHEQMKDYYVIENIARDTGSYTFHSATMPEGDYHFWTIVIAADGLRRSDTMYHNTVTVTR